MMANSGVQFIISTDAHKPEDVGNFEKGIKLAESAGLNSDNILNADQR
jgi:putative hydrolase